MPEQGETPQVEASTRPFWSGTISFGLVSVPVNLLPAHRSNRTSLRMVAPDGTPLARRYFARSDDRILEWDEIVRGYEVEADRYVIVEDDELEKIAPERTRDIDLRVFVDAATIDPMHFERAYFLTPAADSSKAYRLLAKVMEDTDRAGIATFVMRGKEYLVAILAENGILRAETLRFADEVRTPETVGLPKPKKPNEARVREISREIGESTEKELDSSVLTDRYAERLHALVTDRVESGERVTDAPEEPEDESREIIDLMQLLQRSLEGGRAGASRDGGTNGRAKKDAQAKHGRGQDTASALRERSKGELYEQAQELDISGRSSMSKDELIEAIRRSG